MDIPSISAEPAHSIPSVRSCPCCGSDSVAYAAYDRSIRQTDLVQCLSCGLEIEEDELGAALAVWNTRATPPMIRGDWLAGLQAGISAIEALHGASASVTILNEVYDFISDLLSRDPEEAPPAIVSAVDEAHPASDVLDEEDLSPLNIMTILGNRLIAERSARSHLPGAALGSSIVGEEVVDRSPTPVVRLAGCGCHACLEGLFTPSGFPLSSTRMILCPICGNKRCPKANDHRHACTGSNEPGQTGSAYPKVGSSAPLSGGEGPIEKPSILPQPSVEDIAVERVQERLERALQASDLNEVRRILADVADHEGRSRVVIAALRTSSRVRTLLNVWDLLLTLQRTSLPEEEHRRLRGLRLTSEDPA